MRAHTGRVDIAPSALVELMSVVHALSRDRTKLDAPWRDELIARRPDLVRAIRNLPIRPPDNLELVPRGYDLFAVVCTTGFISQSDPEPFLDRFPELVERVRAEWSDHELFADDFLQRIEARKQRLETMRDPDFQAVYVSLLRDVWSEIGPLWEEEGLPILQVECARVQQKLQEGEDVLSIFPEGHFLTFERYATFVKEADVRRDLVITPLYFSRGGYLMEESEDRTLYVGYSPLHEGVQHATATKAADVAVRLKAFSDPTRLALLSTISDLEVTVGDLAKLLNITQPSVSGHLRLLEQTGLVQVRKKGVKSFYRADKQAIATLLKEASDLLR